MDYYGKSEVVRRFWDRNGEIIVSSVALVGIGIFGRKCVRGKNRKMEVLVGKIVETKNGKIQGIVLGSRDGRDFYGWHKIPYATAPLGELRFADPLPVGNWEGILDGSKYGPCCPQLNLFTEKISGDEDCLFLNIFTPKQPFESNRKLPVIFNIHGGAFAIGDASFLRPHYFMDEDVVIVTINYRLDILGFLSTGDDVVRGNMGLKDQVIALKWVNNNIEFFGGDPEKITIMGQSAGACSVQDMMLSNLSKGLFHKGISQSGVATMTLGVQTAEEASKSAREVARLFGCEAESSEEIVAYLRKLPVQELFKTRSHIIWKDSFITDPNNTRTGFLPVVEAIKDDKAFLTDLPIKLISAGKANTVPWLVGHTMDEGLLNSTAFLKNPKSLLKFETNPACISHAFGVKSDDIDSKTNVGKKIQDFYISQTERQNLSHYEKFQKYTTMLTDSWLGFDTREAIFSQRALSSPIYFYIYSKTDLPMAYTNFNVAITRTRPFYLDVGLYSIKKFTYKTLLRRDPPFYGVDHCSDGMLYLGHSRIIPNSKHYDYSKEFVRLLVNFAADEEKLYFRGEEFLPCGLEEELQVFVFDNEKGSMVADPLGNRFKFLKSLKFRDYH